MAPNMMLPNGMILPKGIVMNHDLIYHSVAEYPVVPREQIYEYWHVYTVTCRTLIDPTAQRLENFWWHVLGSDRRELSGKTLARLFEDISKGPTFVRLRGPPNRYEGPDPSSPVEESAAVPLGKVVSREKGDSKGPVVSTEQPKIQPSQSSSSRPPPPHPILKKPRGPSTSGPRPTARFVSPPGSEDESTGQVEPGPSSSRKKAPAEKEPESQAPPAAKGERKKSTGVAPKKKTTFVASTARRRPAMPRRQSSQSSSGATEAAPKDGASSISSRSGSQRPVSPIAERSAKKNASGAREANEKMSAKAAGKLPATKPKPAPTNDAASFRVVGGTLPVIVQDEKAISAKISSELIGDKKEQMAEVERNADPLKAPLFRHSSAQRQKEMPKAPAIMRTRSENGPQAGSVREGLGRVPPHGLISSSTATTSTVAARGTMTDFDDNMRAQMIPVQEGRGEGASSRSGGSLLDSRFAPTPPSTAPNLPLARSKSQLTLLLERQNEKKPRR
ncbi:hypothetical protein PG995_003552 [Apiospora arundinis]|uniref:Nitrogen regulatory protein areA GATA-like domain-containing protein n=1 Tax=Apiospora arundinis TaxID=335852 RepID=A0ABR2HRP2_9PEZI